METSSAKFFVDADGWIKNRDDLVVIQITVAGLSTGDNGKRFRFKPATLSDPVQVEWDADTEYQTFPRDVSVVMVRKGYAVKAPEEMLDKVNADLGGAEKEAPVEKQEDTPPPPTPKRGRPKKEQPDG